jgi:hypothetical protein
MSTYQQIEAAADSSRLTLFVLLGVNSPLQKLCYATEIRRHNCVFELRRNY